MVDATSPGTPAANTEAAGSATRAFERPVGGLKRFLPRTLFGRTLLIIVVPAILMQAIATFIFFDRHVETLSRRLAQAVAGDIAMVVNQMNGLEDHQRQLLFNQAASATSLIYTYLPGGEMQPVPQTQSYAVLRRELQVAMDERVSLPHSVDPLFEQKRTLIQVELPSGVLMVSVPTKRLWSSTTTVFLLWMIGSGVVLFAISILFMRNQIRPIGRLAKAADRFGKGLDVANFKVEGALEVRRAARAFLVMRQRIQRQINQRTDMLAGVSHDLRTPLTRMKLELELLGDSPETQELREDVAEMERMIDGYLAFARGEGTEQSETINVISMVEDVVTSARREGANARFDIHGDVTGGHADLTVRPQALRRAIANLLSNARRHA
ncbi:MAG: histidine kinase dimerization/phospho-acceptor domain-containing protein, partial [Pseudomonadota bacterium]